MPRDTKLKRFTEQIDRSLSGYATVIDSPTIDNFVSIDANGDIQDSGYDAGSFPLLSQAVLVTGTNDIVMSSGEWRVGDASNYAQFAADGEQTFAGTARFWKQRLLKPESVKLPGVNPPAEDDIDNFIFHRYNRQTEESVFYIFEIPTDFATGSNSIRMRFHFVVENPPAGGGGNENVRMGFEYKKLSDGDVFSFTAGTSSVTIDETITAGETALIIHTTAYGSLSTTGLVSGDCVLFRFYRDATAVEDTYDNEAVQDDNDVWAFIYDLEYLSDKHGESS